MSVIEEKKFSFPFPPYEIQQNFMDTLFSALENEKLGIFESPTGTGKSLSLICGSLSWLKSYTTSHKEKLKSLVEEDLPEVDAYDWFNASTKKIEKENEKRKAKIALEKIEKEEKKIKSLKLKFVRNKTRSEIAKRNDNLQNTLEKSKENQTGVDNAEREPTEDEFLLDDYDSEGGEASSESDTDEDEEQGTLKIFYCSRTHSQLSQFVREVQKTSFKEDARVTVLGSRKTLCVNDDVNRLSSLSLINERCLDLQTKQKGISTKIEDDKAAKKKKVTGGCPFNKQGLIQNLSEQVVIDVQDIEQLFKNGLKLKACPYYASRKSIKDSQLIVLPYNCLLHKSTRKACKISLKGNIVIIDEAHNLLETIGNIHSAMISYQQLCEANSQLTEYLRRFEKRLSSKNLLYIKQILFIISAYKNLLFPELPLRNKNSAEPKPTSRVLKLHDFLFETLTDNLSTFKLIQYMENSKLAHKLHGYRKAVQGEVKIKSHLPQRKEPDSISSYLAKMGKTENKNLQIKETNIVPIVGKSSVTDEVKCGSPLLSLIEFLKAIIGGDGGGEGRIVVNIDAGSNKMKSLIKYLLLNPASQFHDVVREARSIILAGGTMSPVDEFKNQLFFSAGASPDRVIEFSCGHVVPDGNVLPLVLTKGPCSVPLDFTFKNRKEKPLLDELGRTLANMCSIIPGGIVIFLPSYEYEEFLYGYFTKEKILERISSKKLVFREPKKASQLDKVLHDYSEAAKNPQNGKRGAVLFSVVGGKMSEGINFSDELGRCVVMVGLPYPNATSPELKEKRDYLNKHYPPNENGKTAGAVYYDNLCFKAVNQSIGRAIRHRNDYACIILLDQRYALESSQMSLTSWINSRIRVCNSFGQSVASLSKFFASKRGK